MPAYSVHDTTDSDGEGCIVFAKTSIEAKRRALRELDHDEIAGLKAQRETWADGYEASGVVPAADMIARGWTLECVGCEQQIFDTVTRYGDDGEEFEVETNPCGTQHAAYCTPECRDRDRAQRARRKRGDRRCFGVFKRELARKLPGAVIAADDSPDHHRYFGAHSKSGFDRALCFIVAFDFPGRKHALAKYRYDLDYGDTRGKRRVLVAAGDLDAWNAWLAEIGVTDKPLEPV